MYTHLGRASKISYKGTRFLTKPSCSCRDIALGIITCFVFGSMAFPLTGSIKKPRKVKDVWSSLKNTYGWGLTLYNNNV